jgi:hypothetical protein
VASIFLVREIRREENKHNLQICHAAASPTRVNQGLEPWVSQRPLANKVRIPIPEINENTTMELHRRLIGE